MVTALGVDVASYQGYPNWDTVKAAGYEWAAVKATEGTSYVNPTLLTNWAELGRVKMARLCYHFARPDYGSTPDAEVNWLLANLPPLLPGDGVVLDAESGAGRQADWYIRWLRLAETALGFKPILYTGRWFTDSAGITGDSRFSPYGLWLAAYQATAPLPPVPWSFLTAWQTTDKGTVPGIAGLVDIDIFYGTVDQLESYGKPVPAPPRPVPAPVADFTNNDIVAIERYMLAEPPDLLGLQAYVAPFVQTVEGTNASESS